MARRPSKQLLSHAEQAALQGRLIEGIRHDKSEMRAGSEILYALDSNIVHFLIDPSGNAYPGRSKQSGCVAVFDDDPKEAIAPLAEELRNFLLEELSDLPFVIPAPLDSQILRYKHHLSRLGAENADKARRLLDEDEENIKSLGAELKKNNELNESSKKLVLSILSLISLKRNHASLDGLLKLFESKKVLLANNFKDNLPRPYSDVLTLPVTDGRARLAMLIETSQWRIFLADIIPNRVNDIRMDEKASAIARMKSWVDRLTEFSTSHQNKRYEIRFITIDTVLHQSDHVLSRPKSLQIHQEFVRFCRNHFRHTRSYLPEISAFRIDEVSSGKRHHWSEGESSDHFMYLWSRWQPGLDGSAADALVEKIHKQWHQFLKASALNANVDISSDAWLEGDDTLRAVSKWLNANRDDIINEIEKFWESCFYVSTQGAALFHGDATGEVEYLRQIPPVIFRSWPKVQKFVMIFQGWASPHRFSIKDYQDALKELDAEFQNVSDEVLQKVNRDYAYYLLHAVLFAARGDWDIGAKVAAFARSRVVSKDCLPGVANGREAFYVEAFCRRHAANRRGDLVVARELISCARDKSTQEGGDPGLDLRFNAEVLAIDLTDWLFQRFGIGHGDKDDFELGRSVLIEAARQLRDELRSLRLDENQSDHDAVAAQLLRLRLRILINEIGIHLYGDDSTHRPEYFTSLLGEIQEIKSIFVPHNCGDSAPLFSRFAKLIITCGEKLAMVEKRCRMFEDLETHDILLDDGLQRYSTFPYDRGESGRIAYLRDIYLRYP